MPHVPAVARTGETAVRGTQSFVGTMSWCWKHPSVTALEVLWRWAFGVPVLWIVGRRLQQILLATTGPNYDWSRLGLENITVVDPVGAAKKLAIATALLLPPVLRAARWLLPVLLAVWVVVSSFGRTVVLRRADPSLKSRPLTLMALQALRVAALGGSFALWFLLVHAAGASLVTGPIEANREPNLLLYCAVSIVGTLGLFTLWAVVSWALGIAPLLAMLRGTGAGQSLRDALRLGPLRTKLVEINLVLGIVKIALLVLAMVFSATPLPFESVTTTTFLVFWTAVVTVVYFVASDFFHVGRMIGYLQLWRAYEVPEAETRASSNRSAEGARRG